MTTDCVACRTVPRQAAAGTTILKAAPRMEHPIDWYTTRSKRKAPAPAPSSAFHHCMNGVEQRQIQSRLLDEELDDDVLKSSKEIRSQIEAVEADARQTV